MADKSPSTSTKAAEQGLFNMDYTPDARRIILKRVMSEEISKLIPQLTDWNNGNGVDIDFWLRCEGSFGHAIAYAELFWPQFELYNGCVFFEGIREEVYQEWMRATNNNKTSVQATMNHQHIVDLFPQTEREPTKEQIVHLGRKLREMWEAKLARDFPDAGAVVSLTEDDNEDLLSYQITFFIPRKEDITTG